MEDKPHTEPSSGLERLKNALASATRDYLVTVRSEGAGLEALRGLSRGGPLSWLGLFVLLLNLLASGYLAFRGRAYAVITAEVWEGAQVSVPSPALYLAIIFMAVAWAYLLTGAASAGPGIYVLAAVYIAFYGLIVGISLGGTLWFVVVPVWLLLLGGWVASGRPTRWRLPLLFLLSLTVSMLIYPSLGVKAILPGTWGRWALAVILFAVVANPLALRAKRFRPLLAFGVSLVFFAGLYALAIWRTPGNELLANSFLALDHLLSLVGLFWYWLGLDILGDAQNLAGWFGRVAEALVPGRVLRVAAFVLWVLWWVVAYVLIHGIPLFLVAGLARLRLGEVFLQSYLAARPGLLLDPSTPLHWAVYYSLYYTPAIAGVAVVLLCARRLTEDRLIGLLAVTVAGFFTVWGAFGLYFSLTTKSPEEMLGFWPMVIFIGGIFWQILKACAALLSGSKTRPLLFLGFMLSLGAISLLELAAKHTLFQQELTSNSFLGLTYLGIPYMLYVSLYKRRRYTFVSSRSLLLLFGLGMVIAIPALLLRRAFFVPVLWMLAVAATVWRSGAWDDRLDGVVYLGAVASGYVVYYTNPILIPVPYFTQFLRQFLDWQMQYVGTKVWPWEMRWWVIALAAAGAAAIQGYMLFHAHRATGATRWLLAVLGTALALALFGGAELVLQVLV
jgi:hypothetical protein